MIAPIIVIDDMPGSLIQVYRRSRLRNPDTEAVMQIVAEMEPGQARQMRYPGPPERRMSWMVSMRTHLYRRWPDLDIHQNGNLLVVIKNA